MSFVIVLAGGDSDEREVSLRSGAAVAEALRSNFEVELLDPADGLEEQLAKLQAADVVFPALHGSGGEDGVLQAFLEKHGIRYIGSDSHASELCFDKHRYGTLLSEQGFNVPQTEQVNFESYRLSELAKRPHVLKPNDGGSSIDTFIVREPDEAPVNEIEAAFGRHHTLLLQELVSGQEITVAVLGDEALPVIEIIPPSGQEFDYDNKYNGATQELCPPLHVAEAQQQEAQRLATDIHKLTGCRDMSRTDFIITNSTQYVLETNTIPGLTTQSLLPKAAQAAGYSMPEFCKQLVETALRRP